MPRGCMSWKSGIRRTERTGTGKGKTGQQLEEHAKSNGGNIKIVRFPTFVNCGKRTNSKARTAQENKLTLGEFMRRSASFMNTAYVSITLSLKHSEDKKRGIGDTSFPGAAPLKKFVFTHHRRKRPPIESHSFLWIGSTDTSAN